ncbi:MAG TPA: MFS transporter [Actinomycetales bacterium]|uniref:MFS transporter n=1 Tax=uncultured Corynebacterium sp. TaxID=159447 RepID=UPI00176824B8|nr:MFS transporter [uncultured Corynebacterium sp.]HHU46207.1 MFS transporter [Actinomycetales bacterium]
MSARTDRATVVSWASWDWGSAAFNAVMVTFIYSVYLVESVGEDLPGDTPTSTWFSAAMAVAGVVIAVLAPVQGRRADAKGARRKSLIAWTLVTIALMVGQFFVRDDASWFWPGVIMLAVAAVTFEFAEVSYFAQLRQVSTPDNVGRVSGFGWSAGYFGGIFLLLICYVGFISGEGGMLGLPTDDGMNIRLVALLSAGWFLIFALPTFLRVPEIPAQPNEDSGYAQSYRRLFSEIRELWHADRRTIKFLVAQAIFRDGLAGVFSFGAILAVTVYGLSAADVLLFGVAANVVAALGSLAAGFIDDRLGPRPVIMWSLGLMVAVAVALLFVDGPAWFWPLGLALCLFVGPAQAASRSFLARVAPEGREGQMFGLYITTGRAVSWMSPAAFAIFTWAFGTDRAGIAGIALVLGIGMIVFAFVPREPARPKDVAERTRVN